MKLDECELVFDVGIVSDLILPWACIYLSVALFTAVLRLVLDANWKYKIVFE